MASPYSTSAIFTEIAHRPWPLPSGSWLLAQRWHNLLFAHWPVSPDLLRPFVPQRLTIDTYEGKAWVAVVPFQMEAVRFRFLPPIPGTSAFPELNVRTYVTCAGKPGVWFFSLDAANALAVSVARATFHLPYFHARMRCERRGGFIQYESIRTQTSAPKATFRGSYRGAGPQFQPQPGSLEHFLIERYCLYSANPNGDLFRGEIHHPPWDLQLAEAQVTENTFPQAELKTTLHENPLLHFARLQNVVVWPLGRI